MVYARVCWYMPGFVSICQGLLVMPGFVGICQGLLVYARVLLVYARVCWYMPGFVGICQGLMTHIIKINCMLKQVDNYRLIRGHVSE